MIEHQIIWTPGITLDAIEKMVIIKAYAHFRNNKTHTANALGIAIKTLDSKLSRYEQEEKNQQERQFNLRMRREDDLARHRGHPPNNLGIPYSPLQNNKPQLPDMKTAITNSSHEQVEVKKMKEASKLK